MKKLSMPENISLKKEVLKGLGARELIRLLTAVAPALVAVILLWHFNGEAGPRLLALIGLLGYTAAGYAVFAVPDGGQSVYDFITRWIRFLREQKFYPYKQEKEALYFVGEKERQ